MATNKKFRLQNGVDIIGEMTFNDVQVIDENGNVVAASIQTGVESIVDQSYVNALQVTAQSAVTAQSVTDISSFSTTDVSEGSNLYYTDARVRGAVQGGTGVSYDQSTGEFSVDLSGGDGVSVSGNTISVDGSALSQNLVPSVTDTYSLGTADKVWKDVFIGPGSLYLNGTKILEDNSGTITMYADPGQNLSFGVTAGGSIDFNAGDESIQMKSDVVMSVDQTISTVGGAATKFGGEIDMQGDKVVNVGTPTADADAATKAYVDSRVNAGSIDGDKTFSNNVVVQGDLTVQGTTTTVNSETISLADNIIDVNSNVTSGLPTENAGLRVMRGDESAAQLRWNEASDHWETYDGSAWTKVALETDDLAEGSSNLYFTDARAQSAVAGDISSAVAAEAQLRSDADTAEASARAAADSDLQDSIDAEVSRAQGVEAGLDSDISAEAAARVAGDAAVQAAVDATNARTAGISTSSGSSNIQMTAEVDMDSNKVTNMADPTAAQDAATKSYVDGTASSVAASLTSDVTAEEAARIAADSDLQSQISGLDSDHSVLDQALSSEVASRQANDSDLQSQITTVSDAVDAIVGTSPESLNTLQEIVAAFEGADVNLQATITANTATIGDHTSDIGTLQGQVSALQNDVAGHDNDISTLQPVVSNHDSDINELQVFTGLGTELGTAAASLAAAINEIHSELDSVVSDLAGETTRAGNSESALDSDITALEAALALESSARATADSREVSDRQAAVSAEATLRAAGDAALDSDLGVETAARIAGDAALDSDLSVEIAARISGDAGLQSQIDSLSSSVSSADSDLASDVLSLQAQINSILSNTDQAAIDSLTEVVSAFENADNSLGQLITNNTNSISNLQTQINGNDGDIVGLDTRVTVLEGEMNAVEQDIIELPGDIKACIVGGLCIETEVLSDGNVEVRVDEAEVVDNSTETSGLTVRNANELGGQEPSHYRIDIYDINGTIVN